MGLKTVSSTQWGFNEKFGKENFKVGEGEFYGRETKMFF